MSKVTSVILLAVTACLVVTVLLLGSHDDSHTAQAKVKRHVYVNCGRVINGLMTGRSCLIEEQDNARISLINTNSVCPGKHVVGVVGEVDGNSGDTVRTLVFCERR